MSTELTKQDRCDWNLHKAVCKRHKEGLFASMASLKIIRDRKLWRGEHDSFEDSIDAIYGRSLRWAQNLLSSPKLPDENTTGGGEKAEKRRNPAQSGPDDTKNAVSAKSNGVRKTNSPLGPGVEASTTTPKSLPPDPLPPQEFRDQFISFMQIVSNLKRDLRKLSKQTGGEQLLGEMNILERGLDSIRGTIKFARPFALCPYCEGRDSDNCEACKGLGWLNEHQYHQAPKVVTT